MKIETALKSAFIRDPDGKFYRVSYADDSTEMVYFSDEDTGDEYALEVSEMDGWIGYSLTELKE